MCSVVCVCLICSCVCVVKLLSDETLWRKLQKCCCWEYVHIYIEQNMTRIKNYLDEHVSVGKKEKMFCIVLRAYKPTLYSKYTWWEPSCVVHVFVVIKGFEFWKIYFIFKMTVILMNARVTTITLCVLYILGFLVGEGAFLNI